MTRELHPKVYVPILMLIVGVLSAGIFYRESLQDWWYFQTYNPSYLIERITEDSNMTSHGERLFWRTDPELVSQAVLDERCGEIENIGCIVTGPKVYIKNFSELDAEYDQAIVTAAHEMLHMAYFRFNAAETVELNELLEEQFYEVRDKEVLFRIDSYPAEEQYDEMHSIFATEVKQLLPELDQHYDQYFEDERRAVLNAFSKSRNLID